jgi:hypothetical protein
MAPRTSAAERYIIEEPASPEETQRLLGVSKKRAITLAARATEALRAVEATTGKVVRKAAKRESKRVAKKSPAKR